MSPTRREVLAQLAALAVLPSLAGGPLSCARTGAPLVRSGAGAGADPLDGTAAAYQAGRRRGDWSAEEIVARALDRCRGDGVRWRAIDVLGDGLRLLTDARAADARLSQGKSLGPLDGVPVFAKSIYDMRGLPTTASSAEWARLYPEAVR